MTGMCTPQQVEISNSFQVFDPHLKKSCGLVHNKFGGSAFCSSVIGMPNLDVKDEEEEDCE